MAFMRQFCIESGVFEIVQQICRKFAAWVLQPPHFACSQVTAVMGKPHTYINL